MKMNKHGGGQLVIIIDGFSKGEGTNRGRMKALKGKDKDEDKDLMEEDDQDSYHKKKKTYHGED